jgi:hypothetical protein
LQEHFIGFAQFVAEAVERYSQPPYDVRYWEIWNEPDVGLGVIPAQSGFGCWGDPDDPYFGGGYYAEMLKVVYPVIKQVNPEIIVLIGGLLLDCDPVDPPESPPGSGILKDCSSAKFFQGILEEGGEIILMELAFTHMIIITMYSGSMAIITGIAHGRPRDR